MSDPAKRSFVELPLPIDAAALLDEVLTLPASAWRPSYWGSPHCSVSTCLLRGGATETPDDYTANDPVDLPPLAQLPTLARLLAPPSPLHTARYAFLFRMAPGGVTLAHYDDAPVWHRLHRVHLPLRTHPEAHLIVEGRSHHLRPGRAWTFNNQALHGFANGPGERVHLILDVAPSPAFAALLDQATVHPGRPDPERAALTLQRERAVPSYPGDGALRPLFDHLRHQGWTDEDLLPYLRYHGVPSPTGGPWTLAQVQALSSN